MYRPTDPLIKLIDPQSELSKERAHSFMVRFLSGTAVIYFLVRCFPL